MTHFGAMIPHRAAMTSFAAIYCGLVIGDEIGDVGSIICDPFSLLSFAAACFHLWLTTEHESGGRAAKLHYLAHCSITAIPKGIAFLHRRGEGEPPQDDEVPRRTFQRVCAAPPERA